MITEEIIRDVAEAMVSDDCRVELYVEELRKNRSATLTASQARELAAELVRAAEEAERGAAELLRDVEPARFDLLGRAEPISPDCRAGKHPLHQDEAWDDVADVEVPCQCPCHAEKGLL